MSNPIGYNEVLRRAYLAYARGPVDKQWKENEWSGERLAMVVRFKELVGGDKTDEPLLPIKKLLDVNLRYFNVLKILCRM